MPRASHGTPRSLRELLSEAIDYAGLFPPAGLGMTDAVRNYAEYQRTGQAWLLGRFVVPVSRLDEFDEIAPPFLSRGTGRLPWRLTVVVANGDRTAIDRALKFNCAHWAESAIGHAIIDAAEGKVGTPSDVQALRAGIPKFFQVYAEIPLGEEAGAFAAAASRTESGLKARTGGITADAFPAAEELARFLDSAVRHRVYFKLTAGLHHAVAGEYALTYAQGSDCAPMFGFVNAFVAVALLAAGASRPDALAVLNERSLDAFDFHDKCLHWRDHKVELETVSAARALLRAFGSCSFTEPVEELRAAGLLA
jgi:hypothetical protein